VRVESVTANAAVDWDEFVASRSGAALYHRYGWRRLFGEVFRRDTHYLLARDSAGAARGVLPLARLRSKIFGDFLVSLPYFNYGGILADGPEAHMALQAACADLGRELGVQHVELRHRDDSLADWQSRRDKVTMLLPLPDTVEALRKRLGSKLRAQIKRPEREGAVAQLGGAELLGEFHRVVAHNMRDLGTPSYPLRFFESVLRICGDAARIAIVRIGGRAVAAGMVLRHGRTLEIPWASSLREANRAGVNMLLYATVIEHAVATGVAVFDFGRCTVDSGTFKFKRQWGAEPQQLFWHYWLARGGELPQLNPQNPKYALAVATWRRLPVPVASWLGGRIIGNLP
jgi:FemAB-related protein (PEP-CTERM system-associated)